MYQVLIVDDEPIVKIALRSMIDWSALDFHICATASNGEEALEMVRRYTPQLIICDLKMPKMDGIELIRAVHAENIPCEFLIISNYEDFDYVRNALLLGAADYILKVSINPEELTEQLNKIREKLDKQKAEQTESLSAEEHLFRRQERHDAWREFFTDENYPLTALKKIIEYPFEDDEMLALCLISFDYEESNFDKLPSKDLMLNTIKNALEKMEQRQILFLSAGSTLLILPDSELNKHQNTIESLTARIQQLFEYYMSLEPAILYQNQIPGLLKAREVYREFTEHIKNSGCEAIGCMDAKELKLKESLFHSYRSPEVKLAINYIQKNYHRKLSLNAVAEYVGLSAGYLCRIFKEETGISINAHINDLRMAKAGELLKEGNGYIKEVALSVGFEDQLYFSRMFKRYYGVTPSEYRTENN